MAEPINLSFNADGTPYEGNQMFKGQGIIKWCAICTVHRPLLGGRLRNMMGGKHWVCGQHLEKKNEQRVTVK